MGNHYHLLVETPLANLDRIMRHINGVYTQRYNRLKHTDGPLFRGRYKAILVDEDAYLLQVSRYIHRNPLEVKGATSDALDRYRWSSYRAFTNKAKAPDWLTRDRTLKVLGGKNPYANYEAFVLRGNDARTKEFYGADYLTGIYGELPFRQTVYDERDNHAAAYGLDDVVDEKPEMDEIVRVVAKIYQVSTQEVRMKKSGKQRKNEARSLAIYASQRYGFHKQKDIAEYFSLSHRGSVSSAVNAFEAKLGSRGTKRKLNQMFSDLNFTKRT